jgi:uncharacterized tellurite resistance protein B-like protein
MMTLSLTQTYQPIEALSVLRLVWLLIFSDKKVDKSEIQFFENLMNQLNVTEETFFAFRSEPLEKVYAQVKSLSDAQKRECAVLLQKAVNSDGMVEKQELKLLNEILDEAELFKRQPSRSRKAEGGF